MIAAQFSKTGSPADVLEVVELPDPPAPGPGEVLVDFVAAPINPSDLYTIQGTYGIKPPLPAVPGFEGIGAVAAVGPGVTHLAPGQRVLLVTAPGTWRSRVVLEAAALFPLPPGDDLQLAMLGANPPTAILMLEQFVALERGDWVVQRDSAVGDVRAVGGEVAVVDGPQLAERAQGAVREAGGDPARLRLALDAVGGRATGRLMRCLAHGGTVVNYGALSGEAIELNPRDLIFLGTAVRGFWLVPWFRRASRDEQARVVGEAARLIATGALRTPVEATYPLSRAREACAHAAREGRSGKVLLVAG
jgi:NADPH:quinone reductase-like Zn-dependent oxidoreductase